MTDLKKLLSQMTIDEKIGQLTQCNADIFGESEAEITGPMVDLGLTKQNADSMGSILNFHSFSEVKRLQENHLKNDRNKIPMLFMMDVIHGFRSIFPIPLAMGCSFDEELVTECTKMAAREATAGGVHVTFTPMVDYVRDARWGRVMETCGEEPLINGRMGAAQIRAFQGDDLKNPNNMATCVKHFAAYGGAEAGRDYNTVELSERVLREFYLPAYKACIDAGSTMIMPSFNSLNGIPSTANSWLMKKVLKEKWGFNGVVISDYNAIGELMNHGVAADSKQAARLAFDNGCDIEMCSSTYFHHLKELVEDGVFTEAQLDAAVMRVLELKERLGLFEDPYRGATLENEEKAMLTKENRDLCRRAAEECAVLLKNDGVLPFSENVKSVALIGPFADTNQLIGFWSCNGRNEECVSVKNGISELLPNAEITVVKGCGCAWDDMDASDIPAAVEAAAKADVVILCLGEAQDYSGEGNSRADIRLTGLQEQLAREVAAVNKNTAALIFNGRPLALTELDACVPAILDMWFAGSEAGSAAANLLFGRANPSGKLTMSFPRTVGQCPIYYNHLKTGRPSWDTQYHPYTSSYIDTLTTPLYPFGYGLSYSSFEYSDMTISSDKMTAEDTITVTVKVKNTSTVAGKETVQLYIRDLVGSTTRPVQQLVDYKKLYFAAGEEKTVSFTVTEPMLRIWSSENRFTSENGEFNVMIGHADSFVDTKSFQLI